MTFQKGPLAVLYKVCLDMGDHYEGRCFKLTLQVGVIIDRSYTDEIQVSQTF